MVDSGTYLRRRAALRNALRYADQAARCESDPTRLKAAARAIACLISTEEDPTAIAATLLTRSPASVQVETGVTPPSVAELLQAIERLIHLAFTRNERTKPQSLRQATRRAYLTGGLASVGVVGLLFSSWMAYLWLSPEGVVITYYNGTHFDRPAARRVGRTLCADYDTDRPAWGVHRKNWSARWEGCLVAPADAEYSFYMQNMDGARLFIDGQRLIDNWSEQEWQTSGRHADVRLTKGSHRLILEHYSASGPAGIRVCWVGGGVPANSIIGPPYLRKE